jgi:hypothetical protein
MKDAENITGFVISFAAGWAFAFSAAFASWVAKTYRFLQAKPDSLDGHWISVFPSAGEGTIFEIIKIKTAGKNIRIDYQSYKFFEEKYMAVRSGYGKGQLKAGTISCAYGREGDNIGVIGSYVLKQVVFNDQICLAGHYVQREDDNEESYFSSGTMAFVKIQIPLYKRVITMYRPLFTSPEALIKYLKSKVTHVIKTSNDLRKTINPISQHGATKESQLNSFIGN